MAAISNYGYSLSIEPYCENCMSFEPKHEMLDVSDMKTTTIMHYVFCENRTKCQRINEHMKKTLAEMITEKRIENASKE